MICVCQRVRTHSTWDRRVKLRRAIHLVITGNVFRSITRTERAPYKLNMHSHTQQTFVSNDFGGGVSHTRWGHLVGRRGACAPLYVFLYAKCSEVSSHYTYKQGEWKHSHTSRLHYSNVFVCCVLACVRMFLALAINSSTALRSWRSIKNPEAFHLMVMLLKAPPGSVCSYIWHVCVRARVGVGLCPCMCVSVWVCGHAVSHWANKHT